MQVRNVTIFSIAVLSAALLFGFQNCAPAPTMAGGDPRDSEVRIIDDWNKAEIQFVQDNVQIHDEALSAVISGLCNRTHNGERIRWALWGDGNSPFMTGESLCSSGQFSLSLSDLDNVVCGIAHRLVVEGAWGPTASVDFEKRCQPLASEHVEPPVASPAGTDCSLEYVPAGDPADSCAQVCYRESKVVLNVTVDPLQCSGLIQKLASP